MQLSATKLGERYGLSAQEMNHALLKKGFLQGEPGAYEPTEKAMKYVTEKDFHRGNGGYAQYNAYWTTRTFDDSIMEELSITPEFANEVRQEISERRSAKIASMMAQRAKADAEFLAKQNSDVMEESCHDAVNTSKGFGTGVTILLITGCATLITYGVYKVAPKVKNWWNNRKKSDDDSDEKSA